MTLDEIAVNDTCRALNITLTGKTLRRLAELGLTRGVLIRVTRRAPAGDPIEISLRGYALTLRKSDAKGVIVEANI